MPAVEEYGVEPIPAELRTVGWRDLFAINFTFFLNPVMYVLGAFAVVDGGLPLWWAVATMVAGQALAFALLTVVAQPGVDYGLTGQVAMRAHLGFWGARLLSSPYRVVAATYWFAAQALAAGLGAQAIYEAMTGHHLPLVPLALAFAVVHATLAVLGFDVMRWLLRGVLPVSLAFTGVLVALYLSTDNPRYAVSRVFDSPDQHLTWTGFATYVTVMCGASLTFVTNVADFCRYTPSRRDMRIGLVASALSSAAVTAFVGGYAAAATGATNPFVAVADLTSSNVLLFGLLVAIAVQGLAANITNVYTAGLSLVNSVPRLGRVWATVARRHGRGHPVGIPGLRQPCAALDHTPRQCRGAADGRHPGRLPARQTAADRRRRALRSARAVPVPERDQRRRAVGDRRRRRRLLRRALELGEGRLGRRSGRGGLPRARRGSAPRGAPTGAGDGVAVVTTATNEPTAPFWRITQ